MHRKRLIPAVIIGTLLMLIFGCTTPEEKPEQSAPASNAVEKPANDNQTPVEQPVEEPVEETVAESLSRLSSVEDSAEALAALEEADELTLEEEILKAALLVSEGQLTKARTELVALDTENPNNADILYNVALLEHASGDADARDAAINQSLKAEPDHEGSLIMKGSIDLAARRYADANGSFQKVLRANPDSFLALSGAGSAQMNLDNLESAVKLLDRAIDLEPDYAYLYVDRARAWKGLKKYGKSEADYGRAIELEPDVEWHYLDRARIRIQYFHELEEAFEDLKTLEGINPDNLFGNIYLAGILDEWKDYDEAGRYYEKVLAARPAYGYAHEPLAKYAYMKGDFKAAKDHFLKAYEFESRDPLYALAAALCMEKDGDRRSAQSLLKEVAPRVERNSTEYEMFRYYLQPGSAFFITDKINKEANEDLKSRMYFYLGARDDLKGLRNSALASYEQVDEHSDFFESDLAAWERDNP